MTVIPIFQSGRKENCFIQSGQIGEADQKGTLGYISLIHQIKNAQPAGYEESEIVSAVIGAIIPSLTFRNVLETISNLPLVRLQKYLQSHYGEQNATDLANNLTSVVQFPSESGEDVGDVILWSHVNKERL